MDGLESYFFFGAGAVVVIFLAFFLYARNKKKPSTPPPHRKSPSLKDKTQAPQTSQVSLDEALKNTRSHFWGRIENLFSSKPQISSGDVEDLEEILYTSDLGPSVVQRLQTSLVEQLDHSQKPDLKSDLTKVRQIFRQSMCEMFNSVVDDLEKEYSLKDLRQNSQGLTVWMIVGVNGAGKTTTIGKIAAQMANEGKKVLVAACDTFRAAADAQLKVWTERAGVEIFSPEGVKDPSAVAFDACQRAQSQGFDLLLIDTAGRLHTQDNLMEELKKTKRVIQKAARAAPQETLIVLDANSGQNALTQTRKFHDALDLTGVILTKLDGSAKGGVALGLAYEVKLPVCLIGVGEGLHDLRGFTARTFIDSIL